MPMTLLVSAMTAPLPFPARSVFDFACFPYQKGDRFLFTFHREKTIDDRFRITRGRDAACAAKFQQTIGKCGFPPCRWWRAGRGRGTEREPLSVMRRKFQPHACIAARSFLLEGRSGSSLSSRTEPPARQSRNFHDWYHHGRPRHSLSGGVGGTPDLRRFRKQPARFSPNHVFPRGFRSYREGNTCSCTVASNIIRQPGSVQQFPMPPAVAAVAMHPRRTQGWDVESANFGSFSFLSRSHAATIALIGADTPRSCSRREGTIESLVPVGPGIFDVALSGNHASTGMLAERNSERFLVFAHLSRYLSGGAFLFPVALSRDYLLYR